MATDSLAFRHLLIRDATYDAIPKETRAKLHERLADWLDDKTGAIDERDEMVGYHLERAYRYRAELGPSVAENKRSRSALPAVCQALAGTRVQDRYPGSLELVQPGSVATERRR